jgi:DNA mismatch endonuclease, patch repair protein
MRSMISPPQIEREAKIDPVRSRIMGTVGQRNTGPELVVRKALHRLGIRFRLYRKSLPGTPDIVLPGRRVAILVHGCFWHRHQGCAKATTPKSRVDFWSAKFARNVERDSDNARKLAALGWRVVVIWECETKDLDYLDERLLAELQLNSRI